MTRVTIHSTVSRLASATAVGGITVLALAVPSPAVADTQGDSRPDVGAARNLIETPTVDVRRLLNEVEADALADARGASPTPATSQSPDGGDGWVDPAQLVLAALAGVAVAGGAVRLTVRHRRSARPA